MSDESHVIDSEEALLNNPSIFQWQVEITSLLRGEREYALDSLGSADEYVRVMLIRFKQGKRSIAEAAFHEALRNVAQAWNPSSSQPDEYVENMLDLLGAFTPLPGFAKVLELVERRIRSKYHPMSADLHFKTLAVLSNYYPRALPGSNKDAAFKSYIELLREHLLTPQFRNYSIQRLIELKALEPEEIKNLIEADAQYIHDMVAFLLDPNKPKRAEQEINRIYEYCLEIKKGRIAGFKQALEACGARFEQLPEKVGIRLADDSFIPLKAKSDSDIPYARGWEIDPKKQEDMFNQIVADAMRESKGTEVFVGFSPLLGRPARRANRPN
jgi:hypothetical protein